MGDKAVPWSSYNHNELWTMSVVSLRWLPLSLKPQTRDISRCCLLPIKFFRQVRIKALTLLHDLMLEVDGMGDLIREAGICQVRIHISVTNTILGDQVWDKVLVVPRNDRGAKREDHLSAIGDQWPLRQEHDTVGKVR